MSTSRSITRPTPVATTASGNGHALDGDPGKPNKVRSFVDRIHELDLAHKGKRAAVIKEAERLGLDPNTLLRLASLRRADPAKVAARDALVHQHRYLAGELPSPATIPRGTPLGVAEMLVANNSKVAGARDLAGAARERGNCPRPEAPGVAVQCSTRFEHEQERGEGGGSWRARRQFRRRSCRDKEASVSDEQNRLLRAAAL